MAAFAAARRRGAGAVDRGGLENRCALMGTQGSNPCLSASSAIGNSSAWSGSAKQLRRLETRLQANVPDTFFAWSSQAYFLIPCCR